MKTTTRSSGCFNPFSFLTTQFNYQLLGQDPPSPPIAAAHTRYPSDSLFFSLSNPNRPTHIRNPSADSFLLIDMDSSPAAQTSASRVRSQSRGRTRASRSRSTGVGSSPAPSASGGRSNARQRPERQMTKSQKKRSGLGLPSLDEMNDIIGESECV